MHVRRKDDETEQTRKYTAADIPVYEDPFKYFADVVKGKIKMEPYSLYAPDNNMMVVRILEAAKTSAATGKAESLR
jgi:predicted dehydrogenase